MESIIKWNRIKIENGFLKGEILPNPGDNILVLVNFPNKMSSTMVSVRKCNEGIYLFSFSFISEEDVVAWADLPEILPTRIDLNQIEKLSLI